LYWESGMFNNYCLNSRAFFALLILLLSISYGVYAGETLYEGQLDLSEQTVQMTSYASGTQYEVPGDSPLGLLGAIPDLEIAFTDKSYDAKGILLLDAIGSYTYDKTLGKSWVCEVNGVILNDWENPDTDGLNVKKISSDDTVAFFYGVKPLTSESAEAKVIFSAEAKTGTITEGPEKSSGSEEWSLILKGIREETIRASDFIEGKECTGSKHNVVWKDEEGNEWSGIPLWILIGMVDDAESSDHYTFNDDLATKGYSIKVISSDGWDTTLESAAIARSDAYIIADECNGKPLAKTTDAGKPLWPLALKGSAIFGGQSVGSIASIEITGLAGSESAWNLELNGAVTDKINQEYFTSIQKSGIQVSWTDGDGNKYTGVPLWYLAAMVDDIAISSEPGLSKDAAKAGYSLIIHGAEGKTETLQIGDISKSDGYIIADSVNGEKISGADAPLILTGESVSSEQVLSGVFRIELVGLEKPEPGDWSLDLDGVLSITIHQPYFEQAAKCHPGTFTDEEGNEYTGIPLWLLLGWVDDRTPHGSDGFNDNISEAGYRVIIKAGDGYAKDFSSLDIGTSNEDYIIANLINGEPLSTEGDHPPFPLKLVGKKVSGGFSVGNVVRISLTDFGDGSLPNTDDTTSDSIKTEVTPEGEPETSEKTSVPSVRIIAYDTDGKTILNETTVDYTWMEENFPIIGDGTETFRYEGITNTPEDVWDEELTFPGGFKIDAPVKGTLIRDLVGLVGGMESGTVLNLVASDGYETKLAYSTIYPNPAAMTLAGEAFLAWNKDGKNVPQFREGYQLFFTGGDDGVFSLWDMHETMNPNHWHYYWGDGGVQYASAAGLATKYVTEIHVFTEPESEWELHLNGTDVGGLDAPIASGYYDSGLVCQFGANHKASYTDTDGTVYEGMPLWFLCGFVDDADQHSNQAYNEDLAKSGYNIIIEGNEGATTIIDSSKAVRSSDYLIASIKDGVRIPSTDAAFPLMLIGAGVSEPVSGVHSITLTKSDD